MRKGISLLHRSHQGSGFCSSRCNRGFEKGPREAIQRSQVVLRQETCRTTGSRPCLIRHR